MTSSPNRGHAIEPLPPALSSMWRLCRLGYQHEPRLMLASLVLSQLAALPDALLALWLMLLGKGLLERIHLLWKFFSLGWQTRLEEDLFQNSQIRSGVLAETQLLATGLAPKGKVLPHRVPSFIIVQQEGSR